MEWAESFLPDYIYTIGGVTLKEKAPELYTPSLVQSSQSFSVIDIPETKPELSENFDELSSLKKVFSTETEAGKKFVHDFEKYAKLADEGTNLLNEMLKDLEKPKYRHLKTKFEALWVAELQVGTTKKKQDPQEQFELEISRQTRDMQAFRNKYYKWKSAQMESERQHQALFGELINNPELKEAKEHFLKIGQCWANNGTLYEDLISSD